MSTISAIHASEILDSRGLPTVQCAIWLDSGEYLVSAAATGTSRGKYEAKELRDGDSQRFWGQGVLKAVMAINQDIAPLLIGHDPTQQIEIDQLLVDLDGTADKSRLGANTLIAVSQTVLKAGAAANHLPLYAYLQQKYQLITVPIIPTCVFTMINGGAHGADNLDIQEFEVIPASHLDYPTALNLGVVLFHKLEEVLIAKGAIHAFGLVGGFTPNLFNNTDAFEILIETVKTSPYTFAQDVFFGADLAAGSLFANGHYTLKDRQQPYSATDLIEYYKTLRHIYHVFYLEDPFQEDDLDSWKKLTADLGSASMIVGDTLLANTLTKVDQIIQAQACNTLLLKPNHYGTISESLEVVQKARAANWQIVLSHRSGETNDDWLADLAIGLGANYVKFGPPNKGERVAKYNRLTQIYSELHPEYSPGVSNPNLFLSSSPAISRSSAAPSNQPSSQLI